MESVRIDETVRETIAIDNGPEFSRESGLHASYYLKTKPAFFCDLA